YDRDPSLWYLHRLRRQGANLAVPATIDLARRDYLGNDGYLINLLNIALRGRPVSMTFFASNAPGDRRVLLQWAARHYQIVPVGLLMRLHPRGCPVNLHDLVRENERQWVRM